MIKLAIFYGFSSLAVLACLGVIFSRNPVRSVLFLVLAFFGAAGLWMMLEAEFLAVALVLVYVGAVMVLFLFVVMMLDIEVGAFKLSFKQHVPLGLLVLGLMIAIMVMAVGHHHFGLESFSEPTTSPEDYANVVFLGETLYTRYILPFEIAGIILLVAMVAAIALAFRGSRSKKQNVSDQVMTRKSDRLTILKMATEKENKS